MTNTEETNQHEKPDDAIGTLSIPLDPTTRPEVSRQTGPSASKSTERYILSGELARGGMGVVYRATDTILNREVAIKALQEKFAPDSGTARRFQDEASITGQLQHPGIPPVHDLGTLCDGRPFLAMKLIKGETLDELLKLRENPSADRPRFIAIFEQICHAVAYAHMHRVIHRDLKPSNIMVGSYGEVQVMDWGLAKVLSNRMGVDSDPEETSSATVVVSQRDSDGSFTQAGSLLGTPSYIPPEQAVGALNKITERSDVFGLGAILAVILTGKPPFIGENSETIRMMAAQGNLRGCFARLDTCGAEPELVALCKHCLSPMPEDRLANADELAKAVVKFRADAEKRAHEAKLDKVRIEAEHQAKANQDAERRKRRRILVTAFAILATAMIAGLSFGLAAVSRERDRTREQKDLALKNYDRAFQASNGGFKVVELAESFLASRPESLEARKQALVIGTESFREFLKQKPDDTDLQVRLAAICRMRANLHRFEYDFAEAEPLYLEAIAILEKHPNDLNFTMRLNETTRDYAQALLQKGECRNALIWIDRTKAVADALLKQRPNLPSPLRLAATIELDRGAALTGIGENEKAKQSVARSIELFKQLLTRPRSSGLHSYDPLLYGAALSRMAVLLRQEQKYKEANVMHDEAIERFRLPTGQLKRTEPKEGVAPKYERFTAEIFDGLNFSDVYSMVSKVRLEQARTRILDQSGKEIDNLLAEGVIKQLKQLSQTHPTFYGYHWALAQAIVVRGEWLLSTGKRDDAKKEFEEARKIGELLVRDRAEIASFHDIHCLALLGIYKTTSSGEALRKAQESISKALTINPDHLESQKTHKLIQDLMKK
jgi:serine/threonine protein kinase